MLGLHKLLKGWWDEDIDVSQVNAMGLDLLAIAARYGHDDLCSELIGRGSDIHRGLDGGYGSAFMEAIGGHRIKTVRLLLNEDVDPNLIRKGTSPLCLAVRCAEDLVEPLLEAGADPNIMCSHCQHGCALQAAADDDRIDLAELLIKFGADVNLTAELNDCGSLSGTAAFRSSLKCAKLFVKKGADVNARLGGKYASALAAAIFGYGGDGDEEFEMVKYLIEEAQADPAILSSSPPSHSPLIHKYHTNDRRKIAKYLIEGGHVQESVLLGIGFPSKDLPGMEGEVATESEDEDT